MSQPQKNVIAAFLVLVLSTAFVSSRYNKSAAFERPFHFSILVLLLTSAFLYVWHGFILRQNAACYKPLNAPNDHSCQPYAKGVDKIVNTLRSLLPSPLTTLTPWFLVLCIVARTILFWRTIRTIHCSWDGLQSFLPFIISAYDALQLQQPIILPRNQYDTSSRRKVGLGTLSLYNLLALGWAIATTKTYFLTERRTSAICPPGLPERMIPLAQLIMTLCDALIIVRVRHLRQNSESATKYKAWYVLSSVFIASAAILSFLAFWSFLTPINRQWNIFLTSISIYDLLLHSVAIAFALVAGIYLLGIIEPANVSLAIAATAVLVHAQLSLFDGNLSKAWSDVWGAGLGLVVFLGLAALLEYSCSTPLLATAPAANRAPFHKNKAGAVVLLVFLFIGVEIFLFGPGKVRPNFDYLIAKSRAESENWVSGAKKSKTLKEAVDEYSQRYGIPPPPYFDKWYAYAISVDSPIIDDFEQIHADLLPFWGLQPAMIRKRTTYLLEHPVLSFGGLLISNGEIEISPHIHGTHKWMMDVMKTMIEPFAKWLPDMQLVFNLDDECRVSVPFDRLNALRQDGLGSRGRLASCVNLEDGFSPSLNPPWSKDYLSLDKVQSKELWKKKPKLFENWSKSPIFYNLISSACPATAPVNSFHWWNRKAECLECAAPHVTGTDGVVSNWTLTGDLCHQPDLAYLHGFLLSPSAMMATHTLFPVFSQSRIQNFADILYPNPWNFGDKVVYEEEKRITWHQKLNSVFWRGASSDGYATHGAWQTFLRARFVKMSQQKALEQEVQSSSSVGGPLVNVSFVGNFSRCDERDCASEHAEFYGSPIVQPPTPLDFQEHWYHRHLVDLDGAGFSGRFLPFLKSASLPYRAALFRTWWEERVHPWRHFVPLDVRLHDLWTVLDFFGGPGSKEGERIAKEGREWANMALRKEDMRVYMFRLLLEWGRIVDDRREELGFRLK